MKEIILLISENQKRKEKFLKNKFPHFSLYQFKEETGLDDLLLFSLCKDKILKEFLTDFDVLYIDGPFFLNDYRNNFIKTLIDELEYSDLQLKIKVLFFEESILNLKNKEEYEKTKSNIFFGNDKYIKKNQVNLIK